MEQTYSHTFTPQAHTSIWLVFAGIQETQFFGGVGGEGGVVWALSGEQSIQNFMKIDLLVQNLKDVRPQ